MHVDAQTAWIVVAAWFALVLLHGLWRLSRGDAAAADPIRPSGPLDAL